MKADPEGIPCATFDYERRRRPHKDEEKAEEEDPVVIPVTKTEPSVPDDAATVVTHTIYKGVLSEIDEVTKELEDIRAKYWSAQDKLVHLQAESDKACEEHAKQVENLQKELEQAKEASKEAQTTHEVELEQAHGWMQELVEEHKNSMSQAQAAVTSSLQRVDEMKTLVEQKDKDIILLQGDIQEKLVAKITKKDGEITALNEKLDKLRKESAAESARLHLALKRSLERNKLQDDLSATTKNSSIIRELEDALLQKERDQEEKLQHFLTVEKEKEELVQEVSQLQKKLVSSEAKREMAAQNISMLKIQLESLQDESKNLELIDEQRIEIASLKTKLAQYSRVQRLMERNSAISVSRGPMDDSTVASRDEEETMDALLAADLIKEFRKMCLPIDGFDVTLLAEPDELEIREDKLNSPPGETAYARE